MTRPKGIVATVDKGDGSRRKCIPENTTPPPNPEPPKPRRKREPLNQAQPQALTKAEQICLSTLKADYSSALNGRKITTEFVQQLQGDINTARQMGGTASQNTTSGEGQPAGDRISAPPGSADRSQTEVRPQ